MSIKTCFTIETNVSSFSRIVRTYNFLYSHAHVHTHANTHNTLTHTHAHAHTHVHSHTHTHSLTLTGMVEDVVLPYSDATSSEPPSLEEMRQIVCEHQRRPPIPDQWNRDEVHRFTHNIPISNIRVTHLER